MIDDDIVQIIEKSERPEVAAERLGWLLGRTFRVEKVDDDDEDEIEPSPRERERRRRQLAESVERGRLEATKLMKGLSMIDTDALVEKIDNNLIELAAKANCGIAVLKAYVEEDCYRWSEHQVTKILTDAWGIKDFAKNLEAQTLEGLTARKALEKARNQGWIAAYKARAAGDGAGGAAALGGQRVYPRVTGAVLPVNNPTEADKLREAAIEQQMRLGRWQTVEEAARYVDGLQAELQRMARAKQQRARAGTMERIWKVPARRHDGPVPDVVI
jgi:hypothetical protein